MAVAFVFPGQNGEVDPNFRLAYLSGLLATNFALLISSFIALDRKVNKPTVTEEKETEPKNLRWRNSRDIHIERNWHRWLP